ncbi:hypothetical protein CDD83_9053 [Cordyceps sp. RAO-2017]|nr:hypothetical protein CDD83_9053 [Cordyceps sp. RAO-2017]
MPDESDIGLAALATHALSEDEAPTPGLGLLSGAPALYEWPVCSLAAAPRSVRTRQCYQGGRSAGMADWGHGPNKSAGPPDSSAWLAEDVPALFWLAWDYRRDMGEPHMPPIDMSTSRDPHRLAVLVDSRPVSAARARACALSH